VTDDQARATVTPAEIERARKTVRRAARLFDDALAAFQLSVQKNMGVVPTRHDAIHAAHAVNEAASQLLATLNGQERPGESERS